jgi:hypothetical protein
MLQDPKLLHLIWWTKCEDENVFALYPDKEFAQALTGYFKHGNVASFVRQLHMYGFHKVSDPTISQLDKDCQQIWEFKHSLGKFKKNDESSLVHIKRRSTSNYNRNNSQEIDNDTQDNHLSHLYNYDQNRHSYPPPPPHQHHNLPPYPNQHHFPHHPQFIHPMYQGVPQGMPIPMGVPIGVPVGAVPIGAGVPMVVPMGLNNIQYSQLPQPRSSIPNQPSQSNQNQNQNQPRSNPLQLPQHLQNHHQFPPNEQHQHPSISHAPNRHPMYQPPPQQLLVNQPPPLYQSQNRPPHISFSSHPQIPVHVIPSPQQQQLQVPRQEHTPQFRTVWESTDGHRPRNPSLMYDPLAPIPIKQGQSQVPPTPQQPTPTSPPHPISVSAPSSISGGVKTTPTPRSTSKSSIKLPPPSFINRANSEILRSSTKQPDEKLKSVSTSSKMPSLVPISSSIHQILRPSLIDLHYGNNGNNNGGNGSDNNNSLNGGQKAVLTRDSLTSSSKNPSIFSNKSCGSICSSKRNSSFGSISFPKTNSSFSVCPHEYLDQSPNRSSSSKGDCFESRSPSSELRTRSPPLVKPTNKSINSPIPRSSTSLPSSTSSQFYNMYRSVTTSPLSISVPKTISEEKDEPVKNRLVSITSLLDNSESSSKKAVTGSTIEDDHVTKRKKLEKNIGND